MEIKKKLDILKKMIRWQDQMIHGLNIPNEERTRLVVGLIDLALEHEKSIGVLATNEFYGSVFTLSRPLFEAYIRAVWLRNCASSNEIEQFKKGNINKTFGALIEDIEKLQPYDEQVLSDIKNQSWEIMNDFTHGGILQALGRNKPDIIEPNYPNKNVLGAIDFAITIGLLLTMEVARIVNDENFARQVLEKMETFSQNDP
jgi:Family of unknown function (DUF6988)